jgi:hypothetical protein
MKNHIVRVSISVLAMAGLILNWKLRDGKDFSNSDLILIAIALIPWVGEFVDSISWGKDREIKFKDRLDRVEQTAAAALDVGLRGVIKSPSAPKELPPAASSTKALKKADDGDLQKGKWGESPSANGRQLSARIEKIPGENYYRRVILRVESTDASKPLTGKVTFHLHPTFNEPNFDESVVDGVAETSLISYGAFTVGAEADNGETKLELDLTSLDDGKDQFFKR